MNAETQRAPRTDAARGNQAGPAHGYAIAERLHAKSNGLFDLPEGTLYPALHRLEHAALVTSQWSQVGGRRRRVYQLTPKGRRALTQQHSDWQEFARAVHGIVGDLA
jgi:DNA-binding PadR family transcriptional regulator